MTNVESHKLADGHVIIEFKSINQTKLFIEQSWRAIRRAVEHANDTERTMDDTVKARVKSRWQDRNIWADLNGWAKAATMEDILEGATFNTRAENLWMNEHIKAYTMGAFFRDRIFAVMNEYPEINLDNLKEARKILCGLKKF